MGAVGLVVVERRGRGWNVGMVADVRAAGEATKERKWEKE